MERTTTQSQAASLGRPRSEAAHQAILDATLELLSEVGYDRLTIASVASRAQVGKTTIYRRWASKLPLVIEAFARLPLLTEPNNENLIDDLTDIVQEFVRMTKETSLASVMATLVGECAHDQALSTMLAPHIARRREPLTNALKRGIARHELPPEINLDAAHDQIMGPVIMHVFFTQTEIDPAWIRPMVEAALFGISHLRKKSI